MRAATAKTTPTLERAIASAIDAWGKTVFGAPRRLSELVTAVEVQDEVLRRVATQVLRREIRERRGVSDDTKPTPPRLNPATIDPYAHTQATLKAASEHVVRCDTCRGDGQTSCATCGGDGRARCPNCNGGGKQRSEKTGRPINCKGCKGKGHVACTRCDESGLLTCGTCRGSGHERAWLEYDESSRWVVAVGPPSPVVVAHPALGQARPLRSEEVSSFAVTAIAEAKGPLPPTELAADDHAFVTDRARVDARLERVTHQQFMRLAVVRRDATYEMSGMKGTIVLSGTPLAGSRTSAAVLPIKTRLIGWGVLAVVLCVAFAILRHSVVGGTGAYFASAQQNTAVLWLLSTVMSIPLIGGLLRAWRGGFRAHRLRRYEQVFAGVVVLALLAMIANGLLVRPDLDEVRAALAKDQTTRAREVIDALKETKGAGGAVAEAEDAVLLAEAEKAALDTRLELLDRVASRSGSRASDATQAARSVREEEVRRLLAAKKPVDALAVLDRWFSTAVREDAVLSDLQAQAHDGIALACADDPCRYASQRAAETAKTTPERAKAVSETRGNLTAALTAETAEETLVARLAHQREVGALAEKTLTVAAGDGALEEVARTAAANASAARNRVALIGADRTVVSELLGNFRESGPGIGVIGIKGVDVHAVFDRKNRCEGLYVVGHAVEHGAKTRAIDPLVASRVLSQAAGRPVEVRNPTVATTSNVKWSEGSVKIVARWDDGTLRELRIGDAEP